MRMIKKVRVNNERDAPPEKKRFPSPRAVNGPVNPELSESAEGSSLHEFDCSLLASIE